MYRHKFWQLFKKWYTPITIMLVPHSRFSSCSIKVPFLLAVLFSGFAVIGGIYIISLTFQAVDYHHLKKRYAAVSQEVSEMQETMASLKQSEMQFRKLLSLGSRQEMLDSIDNKESGSIDIEALKRDVRTSMDSVKEIRDYLAKERDIYRVTPQGYPAAGRISSGFGMRHHPLHGTRKFHTGIDISLPWGTPLLATADGVVSFAGRSANNGNITVIEHGNGYSTVYAHNARNLVRAGQTVKRGTVVAHAGSTGASTGPHVHYEIWKKGESVDPMPFVKGNQFSAPQKEHSAHVQ